MQMQNLGVWEISFIIFIFVIYFLPAFIAFLRNHKNKLALFLLNLLLGWTGVWWVISLVWSLAK